MMKQVFIAVLIGAILAMAGPAAFAVVTEVISADTPTTRIDGSPFTPADVSLFKVYYDETKPPVKGATTTTVLQFPVPPFVSAPTVTFTLDMPKWNTLYYYAVTVTDKQQVPQESALSIPVAKRTMMAPPSAPIAYLPPAGVGMI